MVGVASGALSADEADGILDDFVHSAPAEHRDRKLRDRKLQHGTRIGCLPVIVLKPSLCPISTPVENLL
jgi:hypothetical protein